MCTAKADAERRRVEGPVYSQREKQGGQERSYECQGAPNEEAPQELGNPQRD